MLWLILTTALLPRTFWQDFSLEEMRVRGDRPFRFALLRPLDSRDLNLREVSSPYGQWLAQRLRNYWGPEEDGILAELGTLGRRDSTGRLFLWGRGILRAGDLHVTLRPVVKLGTSSEYPVKKWRNIAAGDLFLGAGSIRKGNFDLIWGRTPLRWGGSPRYALAFGGEGAPLDLFYGAYTYRNFRGIFGATALDPWTVRPADTCYNRNLQVGDRINRFLSIHRIEAVFLDDRLVVGLTEALMYAGVNRLPEPYFLVPFYFFYAGVFNRSSGDDNVAFGADLRYYGENFGLYGELYIDDAQYQQPSSKEPQQIAFLLGLHRATGPLFLTLQYTRVNAWTYLHEGDWQVWRAYDFPTGHPYGPDFDELYLRMTLHATRNLDLLGSVAFRRKGEPDLNTSWPIHPCPGGWREFPPGAGFLYGVVERRITATLGAMYFGRNFRVWGKAGFFQATNFENRDGVRKLLPRLEIGLEAWGTFPWKGA